MLGGIGNAKETSLQVTGAVPVREPLTARYVMKPVSASCPLPPTDGISMGEQEEGGKSEARPLMKAGRAS